MLRYRISRKSVSILLLTVILVVSTAPEVGARPNGRLTDMGAARICLSTTATFPGGAGAKTNKIQNCCGSGVTAVMGADADSGCPRANVPCIVTTGIKNVGMAGGFTVQCLTMDSGLGVYVTFTNAAGNAEPGVIEIFCGNAAGNDRVQGGPVGGVKTVLAASNPASVSASLVYFQLDSSQSQTANSAVVILSPSGCPTPALVAAGPTNYTDYDSAEVDMASDCLPPGGSLQIQVQTAASTDQAFSTWFLSNGTLLGTGVLSCSPSCPLGGIIVPINKPALLAPFIALASVLAAAIAIAAVCMKRLKK